ncbi:tripartite tricarboxylate transporter substrate-binding protein [Variovorax sp. J2P1-59]|uniref:tripartite tricarboxylate transporter substrate-binding protein n=1 Tax=Variovorax flavidus TaxID=3053501 RepID=UPI0025777F76|nr:tripartite tricarboxylate transporter substrate-binding protein [Variovorax sp. J2P1-59]MDM0077445.1 tripartite tricarboxylate transporter substrate-binding protein [Variovorax sp. J2P1-59]
MYRRSSYFALAISIALRQVASAAKSADAAYPTQSIRIVVGYLRKGAIETIARVAASRLGAEFGQPVVIDKRPSVTGVEGFAVAARAAPDGHTLLICSTTMMSIARYFCDDIPDNPPGHFVPVALVSLLAFGVVANSPLPTPDLQGHIEWLKNSGSKVDGIYAPPGTSAAIVDKLAAAITRAVYTDEMRAQLQKENFDLVLLTGRALCAYLDQEDESRAVVART